MEANTVKVIEHLYTLVFFIGLAGYLPQIIQLIRSRSYAEGISLVTWGIWSSTWVISLLYGYLCLADARFCLVAATNLLGNLTIISIVYYNRKSIAKRMII